MDDLVERITFGDITFGAPEDMDISHLPWAYYNLLGVPQDASKVDILKAYRKLAPKLHPDAAGSEDEFKMLAHVVDILTDEGGELGSEHSQRAHYDEVCRLNSLFDGFISYKGDRTTKLSERMLINMELEKMRAQTSLEVRKKFPEFDDLKARIESALAKGNRTQAEDIARDGQERLNEALGIDAEMSNQIQETILQQQVKHQARQRSFVDSFRILADSYFAKVLDVFYVGNGCVTFGLNNRQMRLGLVSHEDKEHILEMVLVEDCYISGFPKVHFKAKTSYVTLSNPNVEGIFQVIKGDVNVSYESSTYGGVIRARAPKVRMMEGFVQKGDLFVPERFATGNWWENEPAVDITVQEGTISLKLTSQSISSNPYVNRIPLKKQSLEELLQNTIDDKRSSNNNNIILPYMSKKY